MALPLILFFACLFAAILAHQGLDKASLLQAFLSFGLAWMALTAWWRKQAAKVKELGLDSQTGFLSQAVFIVRLRDEMARRLRYTEPTALLLLKLNPGPAFEQMHGPEASERLVSAAASALRAVTRGSDTLARMEDGRFAMIMPGTPLSGAKRAGGKLMAAFSRQKVRLPDGTLLGGVTANMGAVELLNKPESVQQLLDRASGVLNRATREGRNTVGAE
jgi:diguanylate cyclase (GGDEF)-like protein